MGGLVLAAGFSSAASAADPPKYGAGRHAQRLERRPARVRGHRRRRHRLHRLPPLRDGAGRAHRHAHDRGRRARGRLEARPRGAGHRGREALRQPGHRRLAQHPPFLRAHAPLRRGGSHHARGRGRREVGRAGLRGGGEEPRGRARQVGPAGGLRLARQGGRDPDRPGPGHRAAQGPVQVPVHRQGQREAGRRPRHHHRQGAVRHRHAAAAAWSTRWWRGRRSTAARW